MPSPLPIHLILGPLGAGKTSVLRNLISQKPDNERWLLIVNEFGALGIDDGILSSQPSKSNLQVKAIPGGCICCSAYGELKTALQALSHPHRDRPDRIWIEPTGLAEPDSLVDFITDPAWSPAFSLQGIIAVFHSGEVTPTSFSDFQTYKNLFSIADMIIWNHKDQCSPSQMKRLIAFTEDSFPKKTAYVSTCQGQVELSTTFFSHFQSITEATTFSECLSSGSENHSVGPLHPLYPLTPARSNPLHVSNSENTGAQSWKLPDIDPQLQRFDVHRVFQQKTPFVSVGWQFPPSCEFQWKSIQALFETFPHQPHLLRAKALLKVGRPWMLFQYANQQTSRELLAYRKDSRLEMLIDLSICENPKSWIHALENSLANTINS